MQNKIELKTAVHICISLSHSVILHLALARSWNRWCSAGAAMVHLAGAISGNKTSTLRGRTADSSGLACGSPLFIFHVMETLAAVMTKPLSIKHT